MSIGWIASASLAVSARLIKGALNTLTGPEGPEQRAGGLAHNLEMAGILAGG